jgi:Cu/Ag efflux pump CusA
MRSLIASSLRFRRLVVAIAVALLVLGVVQLRRMPVDQFPEFGPTTVEVRTEALGLSAAEVEQLITVPLEQDLLNGVPFVEQIHSESVPGLSSVVMIFEPGTPLLDARQVVAEKVAEAAVALPGVSAPPQMLQPLSSASRVMTARLSSDELSPIDMSVLARWFIAPRLLGVPGVANVSIWGWKDRQLQVLVDPEQLQQEDISLQQIVNTTGNGLWVSPLTFLEASTPGTAGFIDTPNQRLGIRHVLPISTADELAQIPIEDDEGEAVIVDGRPVLLGDVTKVVEGHQPLVGEALFRDGDGLLLVVQKFPDANTLEVTHGVEDAFEAMLPGLRGMTIDTSLFRPANYVEASRSNLARALGIGGLLLLLVLAIMLFEWRAIVTAGAAILLSVTAAGFVLYLRDTPTNAMAIAGVVAALGIVIDDAIVDVRELGERLGRRREGDTGVPRWRTVLESSVRTRGSLLFATLIVIGLAVPAFFLTGQPGAFVPSIAVSYIVAVIASSVVALTVTPALGLMLLSNGPPEARESPIVRWLHRRFDHTWSRSFERPVWAYGVAGVLLVAGLLTVPFLEREPNVDFKVSDLLVQWDAPPGTSLPEMDRVTAGAVTELGALPGVSNVSAHVGRAVHSDQVVNVNSGELWLSLDPSADRDATIEAVEGVLTTYPGVSHDVLTYPEERLTEVLQGSDEDVVVRVYGPNGAVRQEKAQELREMLSHIEGIEGPVVERAPTEPTVEIEVDLEKAQAFGIKPGDVRRSAAILLSGLAVGNLFEEQKVFDVVVWGTPEIREGLTDVRNLLIDTPTGEHVRLADVADVRLAVNPTVIRHDAVSNYLDVSASVAGRDVHDVVDDVEDAVDQIAFPLAHHAEVRGAFAAEQASWARVRAIALAVAIGIFLLLQATFTSWRLAILTFLTLPIVAAGGLVATLVAGGSLTMGSFVGLVGALGIAARNAVLTVREYERRERDGMPFGRELVSDVTRGRLAPIVTTALGIVAVLAPFVFWRDVAGLEIAGPMAIALVGGTIASTVVAVLVLPSLYLRHGFITHRDAVADDLAVFVVPEAASDVALRDR